MLKSNESTQIKPTAAAAAAVAVAAAVAATIVKAARTPRASLRAAGRMREDVKEEKEGGMRCVEGGGKVERA